MKSQPPLVDSAHDTRSGVADAVLAAAADIAVAALWDAGMHLIAVLEGSEPTLEHAKATVIGGARAAHRAVRRHPYLAIGIAVCVGVILGCLCILRRTEKAD